MDQRTIQICFALLRSAIGGARLTEEERNSYSPEALPILLNLSKKHDVSHLVILGLQQNNLLSQENSMLEQQIFKAVYRYEQLKYEYQNLCTALENAQIPFLPLKGSVIRQYYPEPWMRTSCDIDVLVREDDLERAQSVLLERCGYTYQGKGSHDVSLFSPTNIHIELHYNLVEDGIANASTTVLKSVWQTAVLREGFAYWYEMPDDMYYFYHIAHMAKHFENGGCGIRPLIDLRILDRMEGADPEKRDALLARGELLKFADAARKLSAIWFDAQEYDRISKQMEDYILRGGVYGSNENHVIVQQQKKGGRMQYALSKIFIPYDVLKFRYPILEKHRWLTPLMQVRRWGKLIFGGHLGRVTKELQYNQSVSDQEANSTQRFLEDIGLS